MSGVAGRSGRRRNVVKDNLHGKITFREPKCWEIIDKALADNDAEIARWLLEEKYGKPKQQVDISVAQADLSMRDALAELNEVRLLQAGDSHQVIDTIVSEDNDTTWTQEL